jgi:hypothetical protein
MSQHLKIKRMIYTVGLALLSFILVLSAILLIHPKQYSQAEGRFTISRISQEWTYEPVAKLSQPKLEEDKGKTQELTDLDDIEETLILLNEKAKELFRPGWIHSLTRFTGDNDLENRGEINGYILPLEYSQESWLYIDENGHVPESVTIQRSGNGDILQVSVRKGSMVWNSITGEITSDLIQINVDGYQSYLYNILQDVQRSHEYQKIEMVYTTIDDRDVIRLSIIYENTKPVYTLDYRQPIVRSEKLIFINPTIGQPVREQLIVTLEDGSQREFYRIEFLQFEAVDQPTEEANNFLIQLEAP